MFFKQEELVKYCDENNKHIYDIVLGEEVKRSQTDEESVKEKLREMVHVMEGSAMACMNEGRPTQMNLVNGYSKRINEYNKSGKSLCGDMINNLMSMAFSTIECNAAMGKIVAAPTAGSSGILPAVLMEYKRQHPDVTEDDFVNALLTATGIGQIIGRYASFAGADGGCQAECGSASAMAAAALVELQGGTIEQICNAARITILNILGLVCDPIGGIVEYPCGFRNASGAVNAYISADMAMANAFSVVPFEQVTMAMGEVGRALPSALRETGLGGVAGTPVGVKIRDEFFNKVKKS